MEGPVMSDEQEPQPLPQPGEADMMPRPGAKVWVADGIGWTAVRWTQAE